MRDEETNSTKAALCIIEARSHERAAFRVAAALLFIGSALAFSDSPTLALLAMVGLFAFLGALGCAEIEWQAARQYLEWGDDYGG